MNHYDEDAFMARFERWDSRVRRERFLRRMEHKLNSKEQRLSYGNN